MRPLRLIGTALAILLIAAAGSAGAATTWHDNRGGTYAPGNYLGGFTAAAPAAALPTITLGAAAYRCSSVTVTGGSISAGSASTTAGSTTPGGVTWNAAMTGTATFNCTALGGIGYRLICVYGWNATTYNGRAQTTYLGSAGKATDGTFDVTAASGNGCRFVLGPRNCYEITGSFAATYTNPATLTNAIPNAAATTSTDGTLDVPAVAAGALTSVAGPDACPAAPNGAVTISAFRLTMSSASPQPVFWETNP